ncbi:MAG: bifunctional UDP-N-acetylmuramoyl-tripeptide:D-alanyl-D-alanine ligase/alanine racemase [Bacteroidetes bacterium]|nr:bifunctional UDP-N-acetylmuramoyl-tripeptide:D-alanyl-D-alanine ligase/alanine racemase [Bacteroidota bacterium]
MTEPACTVSKIASICGGSVHPASSHNPVIHDLLIDSRRLIHPEHCLFVALVSDRNDGHKYIAELYDQGVRSFMVSVLPGNLPYDPPVRLSASPLVPPFEGATFILVSDTLAALQQLGAYHRRLFNIPVIGITGSNGKTIVKEWLFQLLNRDYRIIRSPKSYNSQIGVPLSVWKMAPEHNLAIFEAGISRPGEMEHLAPIIDPTIGVFTNIGHAHDEYFENQQQKVREKLKLFANAETLVYCSDYPLITEGLLADSAYRNLKTFTWSRNHEADLVISGVLKENAKTCIKARYKSELYNFTIPFTDEASIENAIHCFATDIVLSESSLPTIYSSFVIRHSSLYNSLAPIAMRLELKEAINHCSLINDSYNSDINSLIIALDFLNQQNQQQKKTIILSDILQTGRDKNELYNEIASMLVSRNVGRIIGIGRDMVKHADAFPMNKAFFPTTDEFLLHFPVSSFQNETILLKGARMFEFEKISQLLQQKAHETVMEINLDALIHNLNHFRSGLKPGTRTMAMVKAFSYGSGSYEIANVLQFHRADYLAVAYADEGVELRRAGIHLPIMVMSPEEQSLDTLLKYNLEPEIYNLHILTLLEEAVVRNQTSIQQEVRIHLKLDTGMHRLGFVTEELEPLIERLKRNPSLRVQSVFSHLAASEDPEEDDFTRFQIRLFGEMSTRITAVLDYPVLRHMLNSAGITRFPEAQFDMVRLGIGLYGVGSSAAEQLMLRNVSTLKSVITQIKNIPAGETIGYNRKGHTVKDTVIAIVPIGYADGLNRRLGNGNGKLYIHGMPAPVIGNICMDLTMVDISELYRQDDSYSQIVNRKSSIVNPSVIHEGDEVIIFGDQHPVAELAREIGTIPYEVLTGISRRVKRIYYYE